MVVLWISQLISHALAQATISDSRIGKRVLRLRLVSASKLTPDETHRNLPAQNLMTQKTRTAGLFSSVAEFPVSFNHFIVGCRRRLRHGENDDSHGQSADFLRRQRFLSIASVNFVE
jgi:hypothetical protein